MRPVHIIIERTASHASRLPNVSRIGTAAARPRQCRCCPRAHSQVSDEHRLDQGGTGLRKRAHERFGEPHGRCASVRACCEAHPAPCSAASVWTRLTGRRQWRLKSLSLPRSREPPDASGVAVRLPWRPCRTQGAVPLGLTPDQRLISSSTTGQVSPKRRSARRRSGCGPPRRRWPAAEQRSATCTQSWFRPTRRHFASSPPPQWNWSSSSTRAPECAPTVLSLRWRSDA